jgi:hypothetical protein
MAPDARSTRPMMMLFLDHNDTQLHLYAVMLARQLQVVTAIAGVEAAYAAGGV